MALASSLVFDVRRGEPVLVQPAEPTAHELKPLSDIDDQEAIRFKISGIHFYPNNPSMQGRDPCEVIRDALAKALVFYYPLAGRIREDPGRKLVVECTGEGALFVEADADVALDDLRDAMRPPFPCLEELLFDCAGESVVDSPLFLIQVTRLSCGGFVVAHRINHCLVDVAGTVQFLKAIAELARGAAAPSVTPVWEREIFSARDPPRVTHSHPAYESAAVMAVPGGLPSAVGMVQRSFYFGTKEMSALRSRLPTGLRSSSRFEILTGLVWRSRTVALGCDPEMEVRALVIMSARAAGRSTPPVPEGYYGNSFAFMVAQSTAGELSGRPLGYAVRLVREVKAGFTEGYMQSLADMMVMRGRPHFAVDGAFIVSDVSRAGLDEVDFGWGVGVYGGPAVSMAERLPVSSFYCRVRNGRAEEDGLLVPMCLPAPAMERFAAEVEEMTRDVVYNVGERTHDDAAASLVSSAGAVSAQV